MSSSGERLAEAMRKKGISVSQLAEMTGLHASTIYRMMEKGVTRGYAESWQRVAICLELPVSEFLDQS